MTADEIREKMARAAYQRRGYSYEGRTIAPSGPYGEWATTLHCIDAALSVIREAIPGFDDLVEGRAQKGRRFTWGQRVRKIKGSSWQGRVVGFYATDLTREGYAVESEREPGSVQIYPADALEPTP